MDDIQSDVAAEDAGMIALKGHWSFADEHER
jgi:hypothetical protein